MSELPADLARRIAAWTAQDPDPQTRQRTKELITAFEGGDSASVAELTEAFTGRLEFGTAGLRGALGPGPNRMNRVVVGQAAAGLATYLLDQGLAGGRVLIGYDARHGSEGFARDTAEIMAGAGFRAMITTQTVPTPVIAFGIAYYDCVAAVVVTASHNPPRDNGYKVYLGDGSQIVPPADNEISTRIIKITKHDLAEVPRASSYQTPGDELIEAYLKRLVSLVPADAARALNWVYTPLHGVGGSLVDRAVAACGFDPPDVVAEQAEPDPDFPTVAFPNPEEPGAIDLALALAAERNADVVVANDPDADRCAVAVPVNGTWRMLTGDELGVLLGDDALRRGVTGTYACSIVSSSHLSAMARAYDQPFVYTLTGFKWIGRVPGLAYGYEEAIGYCLDPEVVPDKDGISALIRVLTLAAQLKADGSTLTERLDEIAARDGVYLTDQLAVRVDDLASIANAMAQLRANPPAQLATEPVTFVDLARVTPDLPPTDGVLIIGPSLKIVVRPSGTEPKLKCYLEVRSEIADGEDLEAIRRRTGEVLAQVRQEMSAVLGLGS